MQSKDKTSAYSFTALAKYGAMSVPGNVIGLLRALLALPSHDCSLVFVLLHGEDSLAAVQEVARLQCAQSIVRGGPTVSIPREYSTGQERGGPHGVREQAILGGGLVHRGFQIQLSEKAGVDADIWMERFQGGQSVREFISNRQHVSDHDGSASRLPLKQIIYH